MYDEKAEGKPLPDRKIGNRHPCFAEKADVNLGRIHLPVSPSCNIRCRFCTRSFNKVESRPGVAHGIITPEEAPPLVARALDLCPQITVAGIAGPGDTLATDHALRTFALIHQAYPDLIKCLSTNGLMLERFVDDLWDVGVRTLTVTVNAVDPSVLTGICAGITLDGVVYTGEEGAARLIEAQKRGIRKASEKGLTIKINMVLIPGINGGHIAEAARTVRDLGAHIINIIPLIPSREFADCGDLARARADAEAYVPVFRHCRHCRADAAGILGQQDLKLYATEAPQTFSHG